MPVKRSGFTTEQWDRGMYPRIQDATIVTAERALVTAVQTRNFDRQPVVVTDGRPRVDHRQVKPFGRIEWIKRANLTEAVKLALQMLVDKSPVGPGRNGHYRDRHTVLIDGQSVKGDLDAALASVRPGQRVQIVNIQPYAKKLEGVAAKKKKKLKAKKGISAQAKGGIYRPVQRALVQRYGKSLFIDFKMVKLEFDGHQRKTKTGMVSANYTYPALQFYIKPTE